MHASVEVPKETKKDSNVGQISEPEHRDSAGFKFIDNRPETLLQRKFQQLLSGEGQKNKKHAENTINDGSGLLSSTPVQRVIQLSQIIGYRKSHPKVQFNEKEPLPVDGILEGDETHRYESLPAETEGERVFLKVPLDEPREENLVNERRKQVKEAGETLLHYLTSLKSHQGSKESVSIYIQGLSAHFKAKFIKIKSGIPEIKDDPDALLKVCIALGHMLNNIRTLVSTVTVDTDRDGEIADMNEGDYSRYLQSKEMNVGKKQETGLGIIHLFQGGLPSAVLDIIGLFYQKDFDVENLIQKTDSGTILNELVDTEENKIRKSEQTSSIKQSQRKFYKVDDQTTNKERQRLRLALAKQAEEQASKRSVTPKFGGQLRSWHLNDTGNLPRTFLQGQHNSDEKKKAGNLKNGFSSSAKEKKVDDSSLYYPAQQQLHALWKEDVNVGGGFQPGYIEGFSGGAADFRKEASEIEPGYIEVNPEGWVQAESQGRLLYDYIEDRWFLTTDHYQHHFWEIYVPMEFKSQRLLTSHPDQKKPSQQASPEELSGSGISAPDFFYDRYAMNNCLIDAIAAAAGIPEPGIQTIRNELDRLQLGAVGEMLFADQAVVEVIAESLGIAGSPIILYDADGNAQELAGGDGPDIIEIYHTGALHYVSSPANERQKAASRKGKV